MRSLQLGAGGSRISLSRRRPKSACAWRRAVKRRWDRSSEVLSVWFALKTCSPAQSDGARRPEPHENTAYSVAGPVEQGTKAMGKALVTINAQLPAIEVRRVRRAGPYAANEITEPGGIS